MTGDLIKGGNLGAETDTQGEKMMWRYRECPVKGTSNA